MLLLQLHAEQACTRASVPLLTHRCLSQCCVIREDGWQFAEVPACTVAAEGLQVVDQLLSFKAAQPRSLGSLWMDTAQHGTA